VFVLDSFALLAFFQGEPGADRVADLLEGARRGEVSLAMTVVNLAEVIYRTIRERGPQVAHEVLARIEEYAIEIHEIDRALALAAAHVKGSHAMAYADCLAVALAERLAGIIVTADPEFRQVEGRIKIEWLPRN
jgi:predicted nucleic acid-binding protein